MSPLRALLCAALALGLTLGPTPAEARFGKSSRSKQSESKRDDDKTHEATPVGEEDSDGDDDDDAPRRERRRHRRYVSGGHTDVDVTLGLFAFLLSGGNHRLVVVNEREGWGQRHASPLSFRLGLQGGPVTEGGAADLFIGLEGRRFGAEARVTGLGLSTDDGTDSISLVEAHLTWAIVSQQRARVRLEAGVSTANAPEISFVGPSMGVSAEACIAGPLDIEARMQVTPLPYQQVDASAALALHLGALVIRGGYRGLMLNDGGHVDGVEHVDNFHGPYFGLGLHY